MKKLLIVLAALLVLGCAGKVENKNEITVAVDKDAVNLNPVYISDLPGESLAANIFDTLVSYKDSLSDPAPALATSWDITENGKRYEFQLRKGVKFHNGDKFTSRDVKYTIEEILNPNNASPSKNLFESIASIDTPDDYTVIFNLDVVYPAFLLALGSPQIGIVPANHVKEVGHDIFDRNPVGTGPYSFEEWIPDTRTVLVKNKEYWAGEPGVERVIFRPIPKAEVRGIELKSGGADIAVALSNQDLESFKGDSSFEVKSVPGLSFQYIGFSNIKSPASDIRFRKAVYYGTDIDSAVASIYGETGERAYSWIPPGVLANDYEYMKSKALGYNPEKAKELFDELIAEGVLEAGQEIDILSPQDDYRSKVGTAVASTLIKYGFKANFQSLEFGSLLPATEDGKTSIFVLGWGSVPDPDRWTYNLLYSEAGTQNRSAYANKLVDAELQRGRTTADVRIREKAYTNVLRQALTEDYIHIPLIFKNITTVSSKRITGFNPSPQGYIYLYSEKNRVDLAK